MIYRHFKTRSAQITMRLIKGIMHENSFSHELFLSFLISAAYVGIIMLCLTEKQKRCHNAALTL